MKKITLLLGVLFISGCLLRTYTVRKPRKYTGVTGHRGYIMGTPQEEEEKESRLTDTRPITVIELEFGPQLSEGRERVSPRVKDEPEDVAARVDIEEEIAGQGYEGLAEGEDTAGEKYTYYKVQKNDTLQKISKKFYGTTRKWKLLYEYNKDVLKGPDKVYPGAEIKIPVLE